MTELDLEALLIETDSEQQRIYIETLGDLFDAAMPLDMPIADQANALAKFRVAFALVADLKSDKLRHAIEAAFDGQ